MKDPSDRCILKGPVDNAPIDQLVYPMTVFPILLPEKNQSNIKRSHIDDVWESNTNGLTNKKKQSSTGALVKGHKLDFTCRSTGRVILAILNFYFSIAELSECLFSIEEM